MAAFVDPGFRIPLVLPGITSTLLGLIVVCDLFDATYVLLGTLVGVYAVVDGVTMMGIGRRRVVRIPESATMTAHEATSVRQTQGQSGAIAGWFKAH